MYTPVLKRARRSVLRGTRVVESARAPLACAGLLSLLALPAVAHAWILPEHAEITRIGYDQYLPEPAQHSIAAVVAQYVTELRLCEEASIPFDRVEHDGSDATCVPYIALPALAGDHAVDVEHLVRLLTQDIEPVRTMVTGRHGIRRRATPSHVSTAQLVVGTGVEAWAGYLADSSPDVARPFSSAPQEESGSYHRGTALETNGRALTRDLDLRLQAVDHAYGGRAAGSRAHFQDSVTPLAELLDRLTGVGNVDNAVAQMLAHHGRSLQLAVRARDEKDPAERRELLRDSLLEHAFAVHFMQDAFAAGHIGTEHAIGASFDRLRRHDFLNRNGLSVTRMLALRSCAIGGEEESFDSTELAACWTAYGDGYLDAQNLPPVAEATARLQLQYALAADPELVDQLVVDCRLAQSTGGLEPEASSEATTSGGDGKASPPDVERADAAPAPDAECSGHGVLGVTSTPERSDFEGALPASIEECRVARRAFRLLDPMPSWTVSRWGAWRRSCDSEKASYVVHVVESADAAVSWVAETSTVSSASAGGQSVAQPGAMSSELLGRPLDPCGGGSGVYWKHGMDQWMCARGQSFRFGSPDASLWRPLLVAWPTARADVRTVTGADEFGVGVGMQLVGGLMGQLTMDEGPPLLIGAWGGLGFALRAESLLVDRANLRNNFAFAELNIGVGPSAPMGVGDTRYATIAITELRVPSLTVLPAYGIAYLARSPGWVDLIADNWGFGPTGLRLYWAVPTVMGAGQGEFDLLGGDIEVGYYSFNGDGAARSESIGAALSPELRLRLGWIDLSKLDPLRPNVGHGFTIVVELVSGYSWMI